jgi:hypothetical protein
MAADGGDAGLGGHVGSGLAGSCEVCNEAGVSLADCVCGVKAGAAHPTISQNRIAAARSAVIGTGRG